MNRERLTHLVTILEGVRDANKGFNLSTWAESVKGDDYDEISDATVGGSEACGTVCCALGYAALDPQFIEQGLYLETGNKRIDSIKTFNEEIKRQVKEHGGTLGFNPTFKAPGRYNPSTDYLAGAEFFDISEEESEALFNPSNYRIDRVTPDMVIARVRELLAQGGEG